MLKEIVCLLLAFVLSASCSVGYAEQVNLKLLKDINQNFKVDLHGTGQLYDANIKFIGESEAAMYIVTLNNQTEAFEFKLPPGSGFLRVINPLGEKKEDIIYVVNNAKGNAITEVQVIGLKDGKISRLLDPGADRIVGNNGRLEDNLLGPVLVFEVELQLDDQPGRPLQKWAIPINWDSRSGLYRYGKSEKLIHVHTQPYLQIKARGSVQS